MAPSSFKQPNTPIETSLPPQEKLEEVKHNVPITVPQEKLTQVLDCGLHVEQQKKKEL